MSLIILFVRNNIKCTKLSIASDRIYFLFFSSLFYLIFYINNYFTNDLFLTNLDIKLSFLKILPDYLIFIHIIYLFLYIFISSLKIDHKSIMEYQ